LVVFALRDLNMLEEETVNGVRHHVAKGLLDEYDILVAFTGRTGGVSRGPYKDLNLGLNVGDNPEDVLKNRAIVGKILNIDASRLTCAEQVHGVEIATVDESNAGRGAYSFSDAIKGVDALITDEINTPLGLLFADCVPVVIIDPVQRIAAVAHAGWRGVYGGIVERVVESMQAQFQKTDIELLLAFIGPHIGSCCFKVSPELARQFGERFHTLKNWLKHDVNIDLGYLIKRQLTGCGILESNIGEVEECTSCANKSLFSYRAHEGKTGRQSAIVNVFPYSKRDIKVSR
jgi:polyphenol oxidase